MDCARIAILSILDQEDDQECQHRRCGVDKKLPGSRKFHEWPSETPDDDEAKREREGPGRTESFARIVGNVPE